MNKKNLSYNCFIKPIKINYSNIESLTTGWSIAPFKAQEYGSWNLDYTFILNALKKKSQSEIIDNIKKLVNIKILKEIEGYDTYKKYLILDAKGKHVGFMYFGNSSSTVDEVRKIKYNLDYLATIWRSHILAYILSISFKEMELLVCTFNHDFHNLKPNDSLIGLHEYENSFFIKNLSGKDVVMAQNKIIILNPEKILFKDPKTEDLKQALQFRYENGNIKTIDRTSEEVKKEIDELETRQMLEIIGNSNI